MSADLWAAFGDSQPTENPWESHDHSGRDASDGLATPLNTSTQISKPTTGSTTPVPPASIASINSPIDPWASLDTLSSATPPSKTTSAPANAASNLPEDEWSNFESAVASPSKYGVLHTHQNTSQKQAIDDEWSAFETASEPTKILSETQEESTFDDAGVMWDADEALGPASPVSPPSSNRTTNANSVTPTPAFLDLSSISNLSISGQQPVVPSQHHDIDDEFGDFEQADNSLPAVSSTLIPEPAPEPASAPPTNLSIPIAETRTTTIPSAIMQNRIETRGTGVDGLIFGATQKASALPQIQMIDPAPQSAPPPRLTRTRTISAADKLKPLPPDPPLITPSPDAEKTEDDYFDDWDDISSPSVPPGATAPTLQPLSTTMETASSSTQDLITTLSATTNAGTSDNNSNDPAPSALPPSNVPPPSILLSHLSALVLPKLANPSSRSAPNPVLRTAAHILAGRKHRWKRDTHLAQSMSISAAGGAGVKSGMKLTGVDRAETAREDRDAAELLRVFKAKSGALRAAANRAAEGVGDGKGVIELRDGAPIRVEKAVPTKTGNAKGSVAATAASVGKPCVICGLRRAERVAGVDVDVYDGFGEWWIEHWGHKECKSWWEAEEAALRSK